MPDDPFYILYLDDYHAGDVLFLQSLSRSMARSTRRPAPAIVHGSGEHAERLLESHGIFRSRTAGVLEIESTTEHALVDRALRGLNQKIVALLTDAVVSSVGVVGAQRNVFAVAGGEVQARGAAQVHRIGSQGVVPVVAASAREEGTGATGEIALSDAVQELARALESVAGRVVIVFFTRTNLPGIMSEGAPRPEVAVGEQAVRDAVPDWGALARIVARGHSVLLTNSNRLADPEGPSGSRIVSGPSP